MDVKEVSEYLRTSTDTIYDMVRKKEIPHFRVRRRIFFHKEKIDNWVMNQPTMDAI
ncbi:helix-turn-helix domain-containing protein [Alteribacillus sp. YIM 98480]|uniref:helix-turn-helix domain-containing protein n=1 Tax=Alteribacillus sp. YIM 98480 TaxID=2606599 RepID=UPI00131D6E89|nr:helix-turn-helix domain-containing protein [Alteribacillus sp. YIM 98480]